MLADRFRPKSAKTPPQNHGRGDGGIEQRRGHRVRWMHQPAGGRFEAHAIGDVHEAIVGYRHHVRVAARDILPGDTVAHLRDGLITGHHDHTRPIDAQTERRGERGVLAAADEGGPYCSAVTTASQPSAHVDAVAPQDVGPPFTTTKRPYDGLALPAFHCSHGTFQSPSPSVPGKIGPIVLMISTTSPSLVLL
jgi:hypothetical protein